MTDNVSHPAHYTSGGIEAKDALKAAMAGSGLSPMASYWWGCAFKYLWRWTRKNGLEDLRKCRQCIDFLIEEMGEDTFPAMCADALYDILARPSEVSE